jgi:hypothetical protein
MEEWKSEDEINRDWVVRGDPEEHKHNQRNRMPAKCERKIKRTPFPFFFLKNN